MTGHLGHRSQAVTHAHGQRQGAWMIGSTRGEVGILDEVHESWAWVGSVLRGLLAPSQKPRVTKPASSMCYSWVCGDGWGKCHSPLSWRSAFRFRFHNPGNNDQTQPLAMTQNVTRILTEWCSASGPVQGSSLPLGRCRWMQD